MSEDLGRTRMKPREAGHIVVLTVWPLFVFSRMGGIMFRKSILAAIICLFAPSVFAGEAYTIKEFNVKADPQAISKWLQDHPKQVAESTGCEIVSRRGDETRLRQDSKEVGVIEFTSKETLSKDGLVYKSKLVKVHNGPIVAQETIIKSEPHRNGTRVTIKISAEVEGLKIGRAHV